jgi:hypothetical protein
MIKRSDKGVPQSVWLPEELWKEVTQKLPIPCVDLIFERDDGATLYGYRRIPPYRNVWALIGGRMLFGEGLRDSAARIADEYHARVGQLFLVGVFPIWFKQRSDVAIALSTRSVTFDLQPDGVEFTRFDWLSRPPSRLGGNYKRMITKWASLKLSPEALSLAEIPYD